MQIFETVSPYLGIMMGTLLIYGAYWQSGLPASRYKAAYAEIGTRNEGQVLLWFAVGISIIAVGLDYAITGGYTVRHVLSIGR